MYKNPRDYRTFFIYLFYGIIVFSVVCQPPKLINKNDDLTGLKTAGYWEETPIFIDGDATGVDAHNWTWVESQVWFGGGDGTWKNPYIIENITIDGSDSANCLEIRDSSVFFIVRNCTLYSSSSGEYDAGIKLENINNGTLTENNCSNNGASGIVIINGLNNTISSNNVTFNGKNGIFLHLSNNNTIEDNNIINNTEYGSFLNFSESNDLYLNNFSSNGIHAIDNGSFNEWDNGVIGNYWDNYTELGAGAVDANDDGIGDIPYDISGSAGAKDYYPIWDDGDDIAPSIIINDPTDLTSWNTAPPINVTVYDPNFDSLWYKVGADTEPLTNNTEDFLLTSIWDGLGEGPFQLEIFANDTAGNLNDTYVLTLYKDTLSPSIVINSPANLTYWFTAPSISVTIYDDNFDSLWYRVDGTTEPLANNTAEFLLTSIWDGLGEGPFQLEIFANDTFGHINNTYVLTLYKDTINPSIVINSPMNQTYWNSPPVINITVYDMYLDSLWYRVDGTTEPLTNNTAEFLLTS
ncbi:MAG: nitrous oxide reductase family maturation protein NosD, partial [Promethearchaeota archaeon]